MLPLLFLTACLTREGKLEQLPNKQLTVRVSDTDVFTALLTYNAQAECFRTGLDIKAQANGFKMDLLEQGDSILGADTSDNCRFPLWESPAIPPADETRLELRDATQEIVASFSQLFTTRSFAVVGTSSGKPGDTVMLRWDPITDNYNPEDIQVVFAKDNESGVTVAQGAAQITVDPAASTMSFVLPVDIAVGSGRIVVVGLAQVRSSVCQNVDLCLAEYRVALVQAFTVL